MNFTNGSVIPLLDGKFLKDQKIAGRCVNACFNSCETMIKEKNVSLKALERACLLQMKAFNCTPTFLNYHGFPSAICASVNNQLVHGVVTDYILQEGDLITIDLGATYNGAIADAARTWIVGQPKLSEHVRLIEECKKALSRAIKEVEVGKRIGCIGNAIFKSVKDTGFGLVENYTGHGISVNTPHSNPTVLNKDSKDNGIRIANGLSLAIEPLLTIGDTKTWVGEDGWTVFTNGINAHFEDTITLFDNKVHLITGDQI